MGKGNGRSGGNMWKTAKDFIKEIEKVRREIIQGLSVAEYTEGSLFSQSHYLLTCGLIGVGHSFYFPFTQKRSET